MMSNTNIPSPWKNSETAGPTQDCMFPAALEALEHLGDSLERIITPGSTDYAGRSKALPYEKALPYVRKAYTNLIGAKSRQEALRAMQHLSSYLDGICDGWYQRIVTLINAVNIDDTNVMASQSKEDYTMTIKTQIQALARLQAIATTFYVYHKVKGDRMGGPDYDLLADFTDKAKADKYAADYNKKSKDKFHSAIVRTTKIKEESSARLKSTAAKPNYDDEEAPKFSVLIGKNRRKYVNNKGVVDGIFTLDGEKVHVFGNYSAWVKSSVPFLQYDKRAFKLEFTSIFAKGSDLLEICPTQDGQEIFIYGYPKD